jgi:hypothetical protein
MDLIAQVNNSRVKQFIEEKPDFYEAYDLVEPATKLVFWVGEPGDASATAARALLFGSTNESQYVYAKREGQDNVFAVSPSDFNKIPKNPEELRLKRVTAMRSWEVNQITVASATDTIFEASKEASEWQLLKPQEGKPDYTAISELIRTIVELEAESFVSGTLEDYQLNAPALTITLTAEKGAAAIPLQPGAAIGRDPNYYYAARQNPTEIMALPAEAVESMLTDLETLQLQSEPPAEETPALEEVPAAEPE